MPEDLRRRTPDELLAEIEMEERRKLRGVRPPTTGAWRSRGASAGAKGAGAGRAGGFWPPGHASLESRGETPRLPGWGAGLRAQHPGAGRADQRPRPTRPAGVQGAVAADTSHQTHR